MLTMTVFYSVSYFFAWKRSIDEIFAITVRKVNSFFEILTPKYALEQVEFIVSRTEIETQDSGELE
jgi:hypothetical protein